jgi:hypothetical protein
MYMLTVTAKFLSRYRCRCSRNEFCTWNLTSMPWDFSVWANTFFQRYYGFEYFLKIYFNLNLSFLYINAVANRNNADVLPYSRTISFSGKILMEVRKSILARYIFFLSKYFYCVINTIKKYITSVQPQLYHVS